MLVLAEPRADVRARFLAHELRAQDTRAHDSSLAPVLRGWERSRALGLEADGPPQVADVGSSELRHRRERLAGLLRAEASLLGPIAKDFASRSLVSILADSDGVVLHRNGGGAFSDAAALVRLVEGACWSEEVRGTNAIGTALVEQEAVAVLGGAHFERSNAGLFCYATPVRDVHGDVVCVLDVTGPLTMHDGAVGVAVRAAGAALELVLRTRALDEAVEGGVSALERVLARLAAPAIVLDVRGQRVCENAAARASLGELAGWRSAARLPIALPQLREAAFGSGRVAIRAAGRPYDLSVEPITSADGRLVALLLVAGDPRVQHGRRAELRDEEAPALRTILGTDTGLLQAKERARIFAATPLPVLILAETGAGKELFARAIHALSPRANGPFVALNCGAVQASLLESELFGYAPNAFTGASRSGAEGKLAAASGGTLFLDEVADMPAPLQAALLRFLDDGSFYRVGEHKPRGADVRIVCATCRDLPERVRSGAFRQDLFYRIHGACIRPPALRERSDRVWLAKQLLSSFERPLALSRSASLYIATHRWPGNVRELKSALLHAAALAQGALIERAHMPEAFDFEAPSALRAQAVSEAPICSRDAVLREAAAEAMRATGGNISAAARRLRVARSTLYRLLQKA